MPKPKSGKKGNPKFTNRTITVASVREITKKEYYTTHGSEKNIAFWRDYFSKKENEHKGSEIVKREPSTKQVTLKIYNAIPKGWSRLSNIVTDRKTGDRYVLIRKNKSSLFAPDISGYVKLKK